MQSHEHAAGKEQLLAEKRQLRSIQRSALLAEASPTDPTRLNELTARLFPQDRYVKYPSAQASYKKAPDIVGPDELQVLIYDTKETFSQGGVFYFLFTLATTSNNPTELRNILASFGAITSIMKDGRHPLSKALQQDLQKFLINTPKIPDTELNASIVQEKNKIDRDAYANFDENDLTQDAIARALHSRFFSNETDRPTTSAELFFAIMLDNNPHMHHLRSALIRQAEYGDLTSTLVSSNNDVSRLITADSSIWETMDATWVHPTKFGRENLTTVDVDEALRLCAQIQRLTDSVAQLEGERQRLQTENYRLDANLGIAMQQKENLERELQATQRQLAAAENVAQLLGDELRIARMHAGTTARNSSTRRTSGEYRMPETPRDYVSLLLAVQGLTIEAFTRMSTQQRAEYEKFVRRDASRILHSDVTKNTANDEMLKKINAFLDNPQQNPLQ